MQLTVQQKRFFYDFGIRVTVNTDNRLLTDTSVTNVH